MTTPKPTKPHPAFPLFKHQSGQWAKKIRQKLIYFGKVTGDEDGQAALARWLREKDYLLAGQKPPTPDSTRLTIWGLVNAFLTSRQKLVARGDRPEAYFLGMKATADRIVRVLGLAVAVELLRPDDFARLAGDMASTLGPTTRRREITKTRQFFRWAYDSELIEKPLRYGPDFSPPSATDLRKHRQKVRQDHGLRMFESGQVRGLLQSAGPELRAVVLLAVNCGFGNTDVSRLSMSNLDLARGWVELPRSRTGTDRRCPLWRETVEALQVVLDRRKEPKNNAHAGLVFLTQRRRTPYVHAAEDGQMRDHVSSIFRRHLENLSIRRPGLSFYTLRHTFATIASESKDQVAVNAIMGHVDGSMASHYRERIDDDRLRAVVDHVRSWLFGTEETK